MFTTAFDAGGNPHDQEFLVVAGFISSADSWIEFDKKWRQRLAEDDLTYFHMVDFAASQEEFKHGWKNNEPRRRKLLADLMEIIRPHAFRRFANVIEIKTLEENLPEEKLKEYNLNAYALCAMTCVAQVMRWCKTQPAPQFHNVRFVFEDGDLGKGNLMQRFKEDLDMRPSFEPKKDKMTEHGIIPAFTPLQAADFFAYEVFLGCKNLRERKYDPRWALEEFISIMGELGITEVDNLRQIEKQHEARATLDRFKQVYGKQ